MGDVAKGPGVHEGGRSLCGLHQVGEKGVIEQSHHGPDGFKIRRTHGAAVARRGDHDVAEAAAQIFAARRKREDGHDFRGGSDDESAMSIGAGLLAAHTDHDVAERAVVHVEGARPVDLTGIDIQSVAVEEMRVEQRGEQVVGRGDGVEVAVEVEIDAGAGLDLRSAAARGSAFHAEDGAERWFAGGDERALTEAFERLHQADGGHGFAFAGDGRCSGGHEDELAAAGKGRIGEQVEAELGAVRAQDFNVFLGELQFGSDVTNGQKLGAHGGRLDFELALVRFYGGAWRGWWRVGMRCGVAFPICDRVKVGGVKWR